VREGYLAAFFRQRANGVCHREIEPGAAVHLRNILPKNRTLAGGVDRFKERRAVIPFFERNNFVGEVGVGAGGG
jgi:hypothetical protein